MHGPPAAAMDLAEQAGKDHPEYNQGADEQQRDVFVEQGRQKVARQVHKQICELIEQHAHHKVSVEHTEFPEADIARVVDPRLTEPGPRRVKTRGHARARGSYRLPGQPRKRGRRARGKNYGLFPGAARQRRSDDSQRDGDAEDAKQYG